VTTNRDSAPDRDSLFDPSTRDVVRRETRRAYVIAFSLTALVIAGLVGGLHYEEFPFLAYLLGFCEPGENAYACDYPSILDWSAGGLTLGVVGPVLALLIKRRRIPPSVSCLTCGSGGWILDLEATEGRCPRCGSDSFRYRALEAAGNPAVRIWRMDEVRGAELLELRRDRGFF